MSKILPDTPTTTLRTVLWCQWALHL